MRKNTNPLSATVPLRSVAAATPPAASRVRSCREVQLAEEMPAFSIVGKYLIKILTEEIRSMTHPDIFKKYENAHKIGDAMCTALVGYAYQDPEFKFMRGTMPLKYWKQLHKDPGAEVLAACVICVMCHFYERIMLTCVVSQALAIKLHSLVANSMAEERTMSDVTQINSPDRVHQSISTIVSIVQVRQHLRCKYPKVSSFAFS